MTLKTAHHHHVPTLTASTVSTGSTVFTVWVQFTMWFYTTTLYLHSLHLLHGLNSLCGSSWPPCTCVHCMGSIACMGNLLAQRILYPPACTYIHSIHYIHCVGSIHCVGPHHHLVPTFTMFNAWVWHFWNKDNVPTTMYQYFTAQDSGTGWWRPLVFLWYVDLFCKAVIGENLAFGMG